MQSFTIVEMRHFGRFELRFIRLKTLNTFKTYETDEEMKVSEIRSMSEANFTYPSGFSFFEPYLGYFLRETLEIGGEAHVSRNSDGSVSGIFMYDNAEKVGSIYTASREVFDYFYGLKPFNYVFSELKTDLENEAYDIYTINLEGLTINHRFSHEISMVDSSQADEIEMFMCMTHPGINRRWAKVALKNGDRCFTVRLGDEIAGLGWCSLVNGIGRLHSLYVKPQFRRLGMGDDILAARLLWLKSKQAHSVFSEISRYNFSCSRIATKEHMKVSGHVYRYFKKKPNLENQKKN
jgi:ribosomal protein S18 acetylase RimI-like enzyme